MLVRREINQLCRIPPGKVVTLIMCIKQNITLLPYAIRVFPPVIKLNTACFCASTLILGIYLYACNIDIKYSHGVI